MPAVALDRARPGRAQRDDPGGVRPRHRLLGRAVDDDVRPLAVDVDVVGRGVEVPARRRPGGRQPISENLQPLRAVEPLHVGRRRPDAERLDDPGAHLADLAVERRVVDPVGRDELRRDPAVPHRLEDVGVVVRGPVVDDVAVDGDGVVEALVALDELLDGDRSRAVAPNDAERVRELGVVVDPGRALRAGAGPRLEDQRVADASGELARLVGGVDGGGGGGRARRPGAAPPSSTACRGRARWCAPTCRGCRVASRTCAAAIVWASTVASSRVDPDVLLEAAHRLDHLVDVRSPTRPGSSRFMAPRSSSPRWPSSRLADADDVGPDRRERGDEALLVRGEAPARRRRCSRPRP